MLLDSGHTGHGFGFHYGLFHNGRYSQYRLDERPPFKIDPFRCLKWSSLVYFSQSFFTTFFFFISSLLTGFCIIPDGMWHYWIDNTYKKCIPCRVEWKPMSPLLTFWFWPSCVAIVLDFKNDDDKQFFIWNLRPFCLTFGSWNAPTLHLLFSVYSMNFTQSQWFLKVFGVRYYLYSSNENSWYYTYKVRKEQEK